MDVKIGINPNTWALDDIAELKNFTSAEQCLSEATECGYSGMEMGGLFPRKTEELKAMFVRNNIALVSAWYDGRLHEREVNEELILLMPHLKMLKEMGCSAVVYADCSSETFSNPSSPISRRPKLSNKEWPEYGAKMTTLAEGIAQFGIQLAYHPHIGTIIESDDDVDNLMSNSDKSVGLLLDTGHSILAGGNPVALTEKHAGRVIHFHGKDAREHILKKALDEDWSFLRSVMAGVFTVPGDGIIDFQTILRTLKLSGFAGWLVVEAEQDPRIANPLIYAQLGFANLSRMAVLAGFTISHNSKNT